MKLLRRAPLLLAGSIIALTVALAGCSTDAEPRNPSDADEPSGAGARTTSTVEAGDCRIESATGLPSDAHVVPCTESHDEEVFHIVPLTGKTFSQQAVDTASAECAGDAFTTFVGVSKAESSLDVYVMAPTSETWGEPGGKTLACVLFDPAGPVEGSLEGAAR